MPQYIDAYFLVENRSAEVVTNFLSNYVPAHTPSAENYPVPLFSEQPVEIFNNTDDLFKYLERNPENEYSIYWSNSIANS